MTTFTRKTYWVAAAPLFVLVPLLLTSCGMAQYSRTAFFSLFKDQKDLESQQASTLPTAVPTATPNTTPTPIWTSPATGIAIGYPAGFQLGLAICQGPIDIKAVRGASEAPAPSNLTIALVGFAATELYSRAGCAAADAFSANVALNTPLVITAGATKATNPRGAQGFYIKTLATSLASRTLVATSTPNSWTDSKVFGVPALVPTYLKVADPALPTLGDTTGSPIMIAAGRCSQRLEVRSYAANSTLTNSAFTVSFSNNRGLPIYSDSACTLPMSSISFAGASQVSFYLKEIAAPNTLVVTTSAPASLAGQVSNGVSYFSATRAIVSLTIGPSTAPPLSLGVCNAVPFQVNALDFNGVAYGSGYVAVNDMAAATEIYSDAGCSIAFPSSGVPGSYLIPFSSGATTNFYVLPKDSDLAAGYKLTATLSDSPISVSKSGSLKLVPVTIDIVASATQTLSQCNLLYLQLVDFFGVAISPINNVYPITLRMVSDTGLPVALDPDLKFYKNDGTAADPCAATPRTTFQVPDVPGQAPLVELRLPFRDAHFGERTVRLQASIGGAFGKVKAMQMNRRPLELDTTFNYEANPPGIIAVPRTNSEYTGITVDASSNMFPVGSSGAAASRKVLVSKLKSSGTWDITFNGGSIDFAAGVRSGVNSVVSQWGSPGFFLVGGWSIADADLGVRDLMASRFSQTDTSLLPDPSFGDDIPGIGNTGFGTGKFSADASGQAISSFSDGRFVVAGTSGKKMALALFSATGRLVERKIFQIGANSVDHANAVLVTNINGTERILVAGDTLLPLGHQNFATACFKLVPPDATSGSILGFCDDFGASGKVVSDFSDTASIAAIVRHQNKILVAGTTNANGEASHTPTNIAFARYLDDGRIDNLSNSTNGGFGPYLNGLAIHDVGNSETVYGVAIGRDDRIIVVGKSTNEGAQIKGFIARFAPTGGSVSADPATSVRLTYQDRPTVFTGVAIDAWRRFVVVGNALADGTNPSQAFVLRLLE